MIEGSRTMRNRPYPVLKCSSIFRQSLRSIRDFISLFVLEIRVFRFRICGCIKHLQNDAAPWRGRQRVKPRKTRDTEIMTEMHNGGTAPPRTSTTPDQRVRPGETSCGVVRAQGSSLLSSTPYYHLVPVLPENSSLQALQLHAPVSPDGARDHTTRAACCCSSI